MHMYTHAHVYISSRPVSRILAMCKLLEHTINNGDRRLSGIIVKGDRHVDHETGIIFIQIFFAHV